MSMGYIHANYLRLGVAAPKPHPPIATAKRAAPPFGGAWSTGRGLRVGVVDSFGENFVCSAQLMDCPSCRKANLPWNNVWCNLTQSSNVKLQGSIGTSDNWPYVLDHGP